MREECSAGVISQSTYYNLRKENLDCWDAEAEQRRHLEKGRKGTGLEEEARRGKKASCFVDLAFLLKSWCEISNSSVT